MFALLTDLRTAFKQMRHRPGLWTTMILTLALGLGANTAVFSVFQRLLLEPLPFPGGERLVMVYNTYPKNDLEFAGTSVPDYLDRKTQIEAFEDIGIYTYDTLNVLHAGEASRVLSTRTSASLFSTLGVQPVLGRTFTDDEAQKQQRLIVLGDAAWHRLFQRDPNVLGSSMRINGEQWTVIGVMPASFVVPGYPGYVGEVFTPYGFTPQQRSDGERGNEYSLSIARLKPGASIEQADQAMSVIVSRLGERLPAEYKVFWDQAGFTGRARSLRDYAVGDAGGTIRLLQWSTLLVLLIACANVANLMMAASVARVREYAVRSALGAGSWQLARQTLVESLLAAAIAAVVGLMIAHLVLKVMFGLGLDILPFGFEAKVFTPGILIGVLVAVLVVAPLIALLPILAVMRRSHELGLKDAGRGALGNRATTRLRSGLVIAQLSLSVALLVSAGLLMRSYARVLAESPGFDSSQVWTASIALPQDRFPEPAQRAAFFDRVRDEMRQVPGLTEFGMVSGLPFTNNGGMSSYSIKGRARGADEPMPHGNIRVADEGFFQTMRIPLLRGRTFEATDRADTEPVAVIDQLLADKYFKDMDPIGQYIGGGQEDDADAVWYRIVGVVGTVKTANLDQSVRKETYYLSMRQDPNPLGSLVVRSALPSEALATALRDALRKIDPEQPAYDISTLDARIMNSLGARRAPMALIGVFAASALVLSVIGLYGLLSFLVGQRHGEFGVRLAMGARANDLFATVLSQGGRLIALGLGLGLILALLATQWLRTQLFGISAVDPLTISAVLIVLAVTGLIACLLPARLAARVDPILVLRSE
ncbi:MAG: ABC transporter permease [Ahniella sp.]|nr:ABC transporter permease [Ahniella sp.]